MKPRSARPPCCGRGHVGPRPLCPEFLSRGMSRPAERRGHCGRNTHSRLPTITGYSFLTRTEPRSPSAAALTRSLRSGFHPTNVPKSLYQKDPGRGVLVQEGLGKHGAFRRLLSKGAHPSPLPSPMPCARALGTSASADRDGGSNEGHLQMSGEKHTVFFSDLHSYSHTMGGR